MATQEEISFRAAHNRVQKIVDKGTGQLSRGLDQAKRSILSFEEKLSKAPLSALGIEYRRGEGFTAGNLDFSNRSYQLNLPALAAVEM